MRISDWSSDVCFSDLLASDDQRICRLGTLLPRDRAAAAHGLSVKVHAEQLSNSHGAALAARYGALSADHLEHLDAAGIAAMATAGTVAVLLPGAFYFMRDKHVPPVERLRAAGVHIAPAHDCNPGPQPPTTPLPTTKQGGT